MKRRKMSGIIATIFLLFLCCFGLYYSSQSDGNQSTESQSVDQSKKDIAHDDTFVDTQSITFKQYSAKNADEYDRYFIANMIVHHEGAVAMAKLALLNAKHQEIKDLANKIISNQNNEINQMLSLQKAWGYPSSTGHDMEDHSAMGMSVEMSSMESEINNKVGDEFDKAFIQQMIVHHKGAINMSAPGQKNAKHQEIKDLTATIISTQSNEIIQMQEWQKTWGY